MQDKFILKSFQLTNDFKAVFSCQDSPDGIHYEDVIAIGLAKYYSLGEIVPNGDSVVSVVLFDGQFGIAEEAENFIGTIRNGESIIKQLVNLPDSIREKILKNKEKLTRSASEILAQNRKRREREQDKRASFR